MHVPPIWADRSSQQVRRGPPGCLLAVQCPAPSTGSWPPHRCRCLPLPCCLLRPRSCPSQLASSHASGGSWRSSRSAATPDSWLEEELPQCSCERGGHGPPALSKPWLAKSCFSMVWLSLGRLHGITSQPKQASHRSKRLTSLPWCATSNLDKPVQWWISLAPRGRTD